MKKPESKRPSADSVPLTHGEKVLFPEDGFTKADLVNYYRQIVPWILPHVKDRPITMFRYPDGISKRPLIQQDTPSYFPSWIDRVRVPKKEGFLSHVLINNDSTLVYLANQACITPHIWLSRTPKIRFPDQLILDLDPGTDDFAPVREAAGVVKKVLTEMKVVSFIKTTGSRGLHILVPLDARSEFDRVRAFSQELGRVIIARAPDKITMEGLKVKRRGRLFLDTLRNSYAQTAVSPYAVRALEGAPVSTPLAWDELDDPKLTARRYTIKNIFQRVKKAPDPWRLLPSTQYRLKDLQERLASL